MYGDPQARDVSWQNPAKTAARNAAIVFSCVLSAGVLVVSAIPETVCLFSDGGQCYGGVPNPARVQTSTALSFLLWFATGAAFVVSFLWVRENNAHEERDAGRPTDREYASSQNSVVSTRFGP